MKNQSEWAEILERAVVIFATMLAVGMVALLLGWLVIGLAAGYPQAWGCLALLVLSIVLSYRLQGKV